jgi:DNA gyrase/topoisomerase IV subunit B
MTNNLSEYTSDTIKSYDDAEYVRAVPTALLKDVGVGGITHVIWEYITNSMDEYVAQKTPGYIDVSILYDSVAQRTQIVVQDYGRGIPSASVHNAFLRLKTSGKIDSNSAYRSSTGEFGQGAKAGAFLSKHFRVVSHNYLEDIATSLYVRDGAVTKEYTERADIPNGVLIIFEPDTIDFFKTAKDYGNANYLDVVDSCRQLNVFNEDISFRISKTDHVLDDNVWTCDILEIGRYLQAIDGPLIYNSDNVVDKSEYLFELWRVQHTPCFSDRVLKYEQSDTDKLRFDVRMFLLKRSITGSAQFYISVNNVILDDKTNNSVTIATLSVIREIIAEYQENEEYKQFVLEQYNFSTLLLAACVFYHGARHGGTAKTTFKDEVFAKQYRDELSAILKSKGTEYWANIANILADDIKNKYANYYDQPLKKSDALNIYKYLNFCNNFHECRSQDSSRMELYIVEGTSAGNIIESRDPDYQAIYTTRGKPKNAAVKETRMHRDRAELMKDEIYQDLMHILNVSPSTTDMSVCRFSKIIIATDADPDGYHISALHLHNLYLINPKLITEGFVWVANPPLYSLSVGNKCNLFLRDKSALTDARIEFIYKRALDIKIVTDVNNQVSEIDCDPALYREMCYIVSMLGETFEALADQLSIPLLILERLIYAIDYLYPTIQYDKLESFFAADGNRVCVAVDPAREYLVVSIGMMDHPIGLKNIGEVIKNNLYLINKYKYKNLYFKIKGVTRDTNIKDYILITPMQLYYYFKKLDELATVRRYKGLGEMPDSSCFSTLMDPTTRSMVHVTDLGDPSTSYGIIGKKTVQYRKELMSATGSLSQQFRRTNDLFSSWLEVQ